MLNFQDQFKLLDFENKKFVTQKHTEYPEFEIYIFILMRLLLLFLFF